MILKTLSILLFIPFNIFFSAMFSRNMHDFKVMFFSMSLLLIINETLLRKYQYGIVHELLIKR